MKFLKNIFQAKEQPINSYPEFWNWFLKNEKAFYNTLNTYTDVEKNFVNKIAPKLDELGDGFQFLAGMFDDTTAELIITADGHVAKFVNVEELVAAAPAITNWKITAFKQAMDIGTGDIEMNGITFGSKNISFYANNHTEYPDEIDISILHSQLNESNEKDIAMGCNIFLDNYLGELDFATHIDTVQFVSPNEARQELVPIEKLKAYLIWRQKEFVEKYEGKRLETENDEHSVMEAEMPNGKPVIATINTDVLKWDAKASHPWMMVVELKFNGNENGFPDEATYLLLDELEEQMMKELKDRDGYLNIGRETADSVRSIFFACHEFRKPSRLLNRMLKKPLAGIEISFEIYKDKYWRTLNRYRVD